MIGRALRRRRRQWPTAGCPFDAKAAAENAEIAQRRRQAALRRVRRRQRQGDTKAEPKIWTETDKFNAAAHQDAGRDGQARRRRQGRQPRRRCKDAVGEHRRVPARPATTATARSDGTIGAAVDRLGRPLPLPASSPRSPACLPGSAGASTGRPHSPAVIFSPRVPPGGVRRCVASSLVAALLMARPPSGRRPSTPTAGSLLSAPARRPGHGGTAPRAPRNALSGRPRGAGTRRRSGASLASLNNATRRPVASAGWHVGDPFRSAASTSRRHARASSSGSSRRATGRLLPIFGVELLRRRRRQPTQSLDNVPVSADYTSARATRSSRAPGARSTSTTGARSIATACSTCRKVGSFNVAGVKAADLERNLRAQIGRLYTNFEPQRVARASCAACACSSSARRSARACRRCPSQSTLLSAVVAAGGPAPERLDAQGPAAPRRPRRSPSSTSTSSWSRATSRRTCSSPPATSSSSSRPGRGSR